MCNQILCVLNLFPVTDIITVKNNFIIGIIINNNNFYNNHLCYYGGYIGD